MCDSAELFDGHKSVGCGLLVPRTEVLRCWLYARSALEKKRGAPFASWELPGGWFRA